MISWVWKGRRPGPRERNKKAGLLAWRCAKLLFFSEHRGKGFFLLLGEEATREGEGGMWTGTRHSPFCVVLDNRTEPMGDFGDM